MKFAAAEHQVGGERGLVAPWGAALHCLRTLQPTLGHFGPKAGKDATHNRFKRGVGHHINGMLPCPMLLALQAVPWAALHPLDAWA